MDFWTFVVKAIFSFLVLFFGYVHARQLFNGITENKAGAFATGLIMTVFHVLLLTKILFE